ncbi:sulfite exporter TauE/SafE family protein, partial [Dissulfurirhabdus thermomarina]|nr:sulfite exporter TauE/SafE family protein [Dissulfurirhabdus thermomarina]
MTHGIPSLLAAGWLGLLTSVSPCPLAGNLAAICYMAGGTGRCSGPAALRAGLCYTLGRAAAYAALASALSWGLLAVPRTAFFLETHMNRLMGPLLVATGAVLLGWLRLPAFGPRTGAGARHLADRGGAWG